MIRRPGAPYIPPVGTMPPIVQASDVVATVEPLKMQVASYSQPQPSALSSTIGVLHRATQAPSTTTPGSPGRWPGGGRGPPTTQPRREAATLDAGTTHEAPFS